MGLASYPLLTAFTLSPAILVLWAAIAGFFVGGTDLVFFDVLLATCPKENQATYVGIYQTTIQMATFLAPLIGTALAASAGLVPALILAFVLRLAGAILLKLLGVGKDRLAFSAGRCGTMPSRVTPLLGQRRYNAPATTWAGCHRVTFWKD